MCHKICQIVFCVLKSLQPKRVAVITVSLRIVLEKRSSTGGLVNDFVCCFSSQAM